MFDYFNDMSYAGFQFWKFQMTALVMGVLILLIVILWAIDSFKNWRRKRDPRYKRQHQRR